MPRLHKPRWREIDVPVYRSAFGTHPGTSSPAIAMRAVDGDPDGSTMYGHFSVFNRWYEIDSWIEGHFMERVAPGAFRKTFHESGDKIRAMLSHGRNPMLGDLPIGVPRVLEEDDIGARYEVDLFEGVPRIVREGLAAGQMGASFRFKPIKESWVDEPNPSEHNPRGIPERTITELLCREFGPCTFGASDGATSGLRSVTDEALRETMDEASFRRVTAARYADLGTPDTGAADTEHGEPPKGTRSAAIRATLMRVEASILDI